MATWKHWRVAAAAGAAALWMSGSPASADVCELTWDAPCMIMQGAATGTATMTLTICNCTNSDAMYGFNMFTTATGVTFTPWTAVLTIPAGDCVDIPITVTCDASLAGQNIPVTAEVANIDQQTLFGCNGSVKPVIRWKVEPLEQSIEVMVADGTDTGPIDIELMVTNMAAGPAEDLVLDLSSMGAIQPVDPQIIVPAFPEGESRLIRTTATPVSPAPGAAEGAGMPAFGDLLIAWDDDGTGTTAINSSVKVRLVQSCPTDLNGDGKTDGADLGLLLQGWGPCF